MNFSDFIQFQVRRVLWSNELITEYIYDKDAFIDNSPFTLEQSDRISLVLQRINNQSWSIPLATAMQKSVQDLRDHVAQLDAIRKYSTVPTSNNFKSGDKPKKKENKKKNTASLFVASIPVLTKKRNKHAIDIKQLEM